MTNGEFILPPSNEVGSTGIYHLKRLWSKTLHGPGNRKLYKNEWELDNAVMDMLGLGLLPTFRFLHEQRPSFQAFEQWVLAQSMEAITPQIIQQCNALFHQQIQSAENLLDDVLTSDDIAFWNEHGYVIIKNAIPTADCAAVRTAIMDALQMDEHDAATWYKHSPLLEGIMVTLYRHPIIDHNRNSPIIKRAFEQLYNQQNLVVTTDKCGFNPPETAQFKYRGTGLHWDVSLATPIPFGAQGILYLTDTAANQGALTVVDGFHNKLVQWLQELPEGTHPRAADLSAWPIKAIAANAGDFIIWDHRLPHGASPNTATLPRLVQYFKWYDPLQKQQHVWL